MESVNNQTENIGALISIDDYDDFHQYVKPYINFNLHTGDPMRCCLSLKHEESKSPFFYNLYCNDLMAFIIDVGYDTWFFFLDDDDFLVDNTSIERILPYLTDPTKVVICQMLRGKYTKPEDRYMDRGSIRKGHIGMPCIFVHSSLKDSVQFTDKEEADYLYIHEMVQKHGAIFAKEVIVSSEKRRYGNAN